MNKQELEIAKKIAEIEGHWFTVSRDNIPYILTDFIESPNHPLPTYYNPFDWSILGPLMIKYKVTVNLVGSYYCAQVAYNGVGTCENNSLGYSPSLPCAILECIIKSQEE